MIQKFKILGGLGLVGLGYYASGPIKKALSDAKEDYPSSLLIRRNKHEALENKEAIFNSIGFSIWNQTGVEWNALYHERYFNDQASYQFDPKAIKQLAEATFELHNMCLEAVDNVVKSEELMDLFEIPPHMRNAIKESWMNNEADLLGRFDFLYDGLNPPKMIEYNADTPTLLVETAKAQAAWAKPKQVLHKQFNYITNALKFAWGAILSQDVREVAFAGQRDHHAEEWDQLKMLKSTLPFSVDSSLYEFKDIAYDSQNGSICATNNLEGALPKQISWLWKLYPWEWLCFEELGRYFAYGAKGEKSVRFGEPPWKMIISNKALIAYLWQLYPNHPNLLPAYFTDDPFYDDFLNEWENKRKHWVAKPKYSRGGEYIVLSDSYSEFHDFLNDATVEPKVTINDTEEVSLGKRILQEFYPTPHFNGRRITIGSWVVFGAPAGIGVREDIKDVVYDNSSFVPHTVQEIEPNTLFKDGIDLNFSPSTKQQEVIRSRLYGKAGETLLSNLYESRHEYLDVDPGQSEQQSQPYHRTHYGGGGYYGGYHNDNTNAVNSRATFAEKLSKAAQKRASNKGKGFSATPSFRGRGGGLRSGSVGGRMSSSS